MSDPGYRISDFFNKMGSVSNIDDFNVFMKQYWYVWFIISLIIVIMIAINVLMIFYFRRRNRPYKKPDPVKGKQDAFETKTIMVPQKVNPTSIQVAQEYAESNSQFAMEALIANNKYRTIHNVAPLKYNENLSKIAQSWAETLGKMQKLQHSPAHWRKYKNVGLGENLAYLFNTPMTGQRMIDMWYAESMQHDYTLDKQQESSNFTQMIWKGSREVGFGRVRAPNGEWWYGVAMYMPSGNIVGTYAQNVFPPAM